MECTQRLECTQSLYETQTERTCAEQVGFLGICGTKYPLKKGPNKIGRDPQTCQIVLDLTSISRQHAVINILNKKDFMLMDLDSSNKTKVLDKTLQPYIPHPLKNGDTVQFGEVFGIFRLLEVEDDLPMTQVIDIPETPVNVRHVSKLKHAPITTIPESPDVSDRDDSFIVLSQPQKQVEFKNPNNNFIKGAGKTTGIQPVGINKIDKVCWTSSKKSDSFSSQFADKSNCSINNVSITNNNNSMNQNDIHDMETQAPFLEQPRQNSFSIHDADTQVPSRLSPSIHSLETQPRNVEKLPEVCKIINQDNVALDLYSTVQNNDIYDQETQITMPCPEQNKRASPILVSKQSTDKKSAHTTPNTSNEKLNTSDDEICFEEVDNQLFEDCGSQPLLPTDPEELKNLLNLDKNQCSNAVDIVSPRTVTKKTHIVQESDSSTDCEDINMPLSQKVFENRNEDDDIDLPLSQRELDNKNDDEVKKNPPENGTNSNQNVEDDDDVTDCEDEFIELNISKQFNSDNKFIDTNDIADLPTQIIGGDLTNVDNKKKPEGDVAFEDMLTQIIGECPIGENVNAPVTKDTVPFHEQETQVIVGSAIPIPDEQLSNSSRVAHASPFKMPYMSPLRLKIKDVQTIDKPKSPNVSEKRNFLNNDHDDYYAATQEILGDLCTQTVLSDPSESKNILIRERSSETSDGDEKVNNFVKNLSTHQIRKVIGADVVDTFDSDLECTPKKSSTSTWDMIELPDTPLIKNCKFVHTLPENNEESDCSDFSDEVIHTTAVSRRGKKKDKSKDIKKGISKKFDKICTEVLPIRTTTRNRKPTLKMVEGDESTKKMSEKIVKCKIKVEPKNNMELETFPSKTTDQKSKRRYDKDNRNNKSHDVVDEQVCPGFKGTKHIQRNELELKTDKSVGRKPQTTKNEKLLKQQSIKSMLNDSKRSDLKADPNRIIQPNTNATIKSEQNDSSRVSRSSRRCRSKYNRDKNENTLVIEENRDKSRSNDRNQSSIGKRSSFKEQTGTSPEKDQLLRRSKRQRTFKETKHKDDTNVKENMPSKQIKENGHTNEKENKSAKDIRDKEDVYIKEKRSGKGLKSKRETSVTEKKPTKEAKEDSVKEKRPTKETRHRKDVNVKDKMNKEKEVRTQKAQNDLRGSRSSNLERSTVYNVSTESGVDSPGRKRTATGDLPLPLSKRSRTEMSTNMSLRATPRDNRVQRVLFTAFPNEEVKAKLEQLGAVVVSDVLSCTVVLTLKIKRTFKLLCAVGLGKPIVGPDWVQACADTNMIVDPWLYLLKDEVTEKQYNFSLRKSICGRRNVFKGHTFSCTPRVTPNARELKLIVECSGGTWKEGGSNWLCVSSVADSAHWPAWQQRGAVVVSSEFVLSAVLRQRLDYGRSVLA